MDRKTLTAVLAGCMLWPSLGVAQAGGGFAGRRLGDALHELQERGLKIVYSTAVVSPEMMIREEPESDSLRGILDELLRPFGLEARESAGGIISVVPVLGPQQLAVAVGSIRGRVGVLGGADPPPETKVFIVGTDRSVIVENDGRFLFADVPVGVYVVSAMAPGFRRQAIDGVHVRRNARSRVRFDLVPAAVFLDEIAVTPSSFRLQHQSPASRRFLDREEVDRMPHVADDLYRAVKTLPGSSGGDYSSTINIRGGVDDELLVVLDGLELFEPFHFKDFQNIFSTIDSTAVGGVELLTGGFPAEYGDRMSGVMDISLASPSLTAMNTITAGTLNARFQSQGTSGGGRGSWLVSGRAWYPDALIRLDSFTPELDTDYYDVLFRGQHLLGSHSSLSVNLLVASDDLGYTAQDEEDSESVSARYDSYHLWFNLGTDWRPGLYSQTVLSSIRHRRDRVGEIDDADDGIVTVDDNRTFDSFGFKQDWTLTLGSRHFLKWGFNVRRQEASYDYLRTARPPPGRVGDRFDVVVDLEREGRWYSAYLADRFGLLRERLIVEAGLRWDRQDYHRQKQVSPRVNLMFVVGPDTTLRAAWGRYNQSQRLNELQVEDGVAEFHPAQLAQHFVLGVEHRFSRSLTVRGELYEKEMSHLPPRYENLFDPLALIPEAEPDRVVIEPQGALSRGAELLVKMDDGGPVSWWLGYSWSSVVDEIDGETVPRSWDQPHAMTGGLNWALPAGWNVNIAAVYRSGWPTTPVSAASVIDDEGFEQPVLVVGPRNRDRYPPYFHLDLRTIRTFPLRRGSLAVILEVLNATNRRNICCIEDFSVVRGVDGEWVVTPEYGHWAPVVPSLSLRWLF